MFELNETKNQHYYSVIEQKLNSKNPKEPDRKKRRIYQHEITDKKDLLLSLTNKRGIACEKVLTEHDTFSFYTEGKYRYNFERFFDKYESKVEVLTTSVTKIYNVRSNVELDIKELIACKFVNIIRNPCNIRFVNNYFTSLGNNYPRFPQHRLFYEKILSSDLGSIKYLAKIYGVTPEEYKSWLAKLFFFVSMPYKYSKNYLDSFVERLLNSDEHLVILDVKTYSEPCVLLHDKGYIDNSVEQYMMISFNLSSSAFLIVKFINVFDILLKCKDQNLNYFELQAQLKEHKCYHHSLDEFDALRGFNRSCVFFSNKNVYSGFREIKYL